MKKLLVLLVAVLFSATFAQTVIGVNLELSGRFATIGTSTLQGIEAALEQSPLADQITLSVCDNATTVEGSVACANRFVDEGVTAVLGAISSSMSIPAAEVLQDAGIIMISTSSTNPATTQIGDYIFRMAYTDNFQGQIAAQYATTDLGATSAIIFRQQDDDYSAGLVSFFDEAFQAAGGTTQIVDYTAGTTDFNAQINDVLGVEADVIYVAGFCAEAAVLVPALKGAGFAQQIMGADAMDDSQCPTGGGDAFNGVIFTGFAGPSLLEGEAAQRASDFEAFFRVAFPDAADFNGFTLAGADSLNVMAAAIQNAGEGADTAAVRDALNALQDYPGVSGNVTYVDTDGTPVNRTIGFFQYEVPADNEQGWASNALFGRVTGEAAE
jgi:branched-chain amino acid transport system substrate-binding protein